MLFCWSFSNTYDNPVLVNIFLGLAIVGAGRRPLTPSMLCLSWEKRRSAPRQFPMSPSQLSLHIHKERKAPPQPVMNGSSVNRGLSPLTLRITQKCLYVRHLSVSPRALFASDSCAISVRYRGSLCLSRNVIHFRRQTVVHSGVGVGGGRPEWS